MYFILLVLFFIFYVIYNFRILEICGNSMYPTLKNGEYYVAKKTYGVVDIGKIYVIKLPSYMENEHEYLIKRLVKISLFGEYGLDGNVCDTYYTDKWATVLGDNRDFSYDSSSFGDLPLECLKYKVLFKIPFIGG